jgi:hypothetical protein
MVGNIEEGLRSPGIDDPTTLTYGEVGEDVKSKQGNGQSKP